MVSRDRTGGELMIIANGLDIICSYGDTFNCAWEIEGVSADDDITFSVKATANSSDVIHQAKCDVSDRLIKCQYTCCDIREDTSWFVCVRPCLAQRRARHDAAFSCKFTHKGGGSQ